MSHIHWNETSFDEFRSVVLASEDPAEAALELLSAWADRQLDTHPDAGADIAVWDRNIGALLEDLDATIGGLPEVYRFDGSERSVRQFCWSNLIQVSTQDGDLLLHPKQFHLQLLTEASLGCPRSSEAISIVVAALRSMMHATLTSESTRPIGAVSDHIDTLLPVLEHVAPAGDVAYVRRLRSYSFPSEVSEAEAEQRVLDLRRLGPFPERPVKLHRHDHLAWIGDVNDILTNPEPRWMDINVKNGRMFAP